MSHPKQHTSSESSVQVSELATADWQQLVQERLPSTLESQARALGAFVRVRRIQSASLLLRALLCYVLSLSSLKDLSMWSRLVGVTDGVISGQGWHKRLRQSLAWLLWLFGALLAAPPPSWSGPTSQRILLVDGTEVKSLGAKGELWRLHCAYNLLSGCLAWVQVTTRQVGESLGLVPVQPGDILVGDGIYSRAPQLVAVEQKGGFSLTRFSPHHLPVYAAQAPTCSSAYQFDVNGWLHTLAPGVYERNALVHYEQTMLSVRVIAIVPTPEKAEALRRKKEHEARAKGRKLSEQARFLAGFILLVTTLPLPQWPTALVIELYACRWHIEIVQSQMTKPHMLTALGGGDHIADLHLLSRHDDPIDEQFDELAFLLKGSLSQSLLHTLTKGFDGLHHFSQLIVALNVYLQLTYLRSKRLQSLLQVVSSALVLV